MRKRITHRQWWHRLIHRKCWNCNVALRPVDEFYGWRWRDWLYDESSVPATHGSYRRLKVVWRHAR